MNGTVRTSPVGAAELAPQLVDARGVELGVDVELGPERPGRAVANTGRPSVVLDLRVLVGEGRAVAAHDHDVPGRGEERLQVVDGLAGRRVGEGEVQVAGLPDDGLAAELDLDTVDHRRAGAGLQRDRLPARCRPR